MLRALLGTVWLLATACSAPVYVRVTVQGYGADAAASAEFRGFRCEPADAGGEHALRDEAVGRVLAGLLAARGLEELPADAAPGPADLVFRVRTAYSEESHYVPPETRWHHVYHPGGIWHHPVAGECGVHWITVHEPGSWHLETYSYGGFLEIVGTHRLTLSCAGAAGGELWRGELTAVGPTGDHLAVMRACLPRLLEEFPAPSGKPADERIRLEDAE